MCCSWFSGKCPKAVSICQSVRWSSSQIYTPNCTGEASRWRSVHPVISHTTSEGWTQQNKTPRVLPGISTLPVPSSQQLIFMTRIWGLGGFLSSAMNFGMQLSKAVTVTTKWGSRKQDVSVGWMSPSAQHFPMRLKKSRCCHQHRVAVSVASTKVFLSGGLVAMV